MVSLLAGSQNAALAGAFDLGAIMSFLPKDPQHILMVLDGFNGRSLFKVDLETGRGEQVERPNAAVVGWWLDVDGNPVVRTTVSSGTVKLFRKDAEGKWRKFYSMRMREMKERPEYEAVGPSDQAGKHYVLARPPGKDRIGLYLYDLEKEQFGEPLIENPIYDLDSAQVSRDGKQVIRHCYRAHVRICSFADPKIDAHMTGIRKYFEESANVYTFDSSEDGNSILLYVEGPRDPPVTTSTRPKSKASSWSAPSARLAHRDAPAGLGDQLQNARRQATHRLSDRAHGRRRQSEVAAGTHAAWRPEMRDTLSFDRGCNTWPRAATRSFS
jgi:dipeptidyl aminopeptidase/acylaminoacyl peptidase